MPTEFIGAVPFTDWLHEVVELDPKGFMLTSTDVSDTNGTAPLPFETARPGVFAAREGSSAIRSVHEFLAPSGHSARDGLLRKRCRNHNEWTFWERFQTLSS